MPLSNVASGQRSSSWTCPLPCQPRLPQGRRGTRLCRAPTTHYSCAAYSRMRNGDTAPWTRLSRHRRRHVHHLFRLPLVRGCHRRLACSACCRSKVLLQQRCQDRLRWQLRHLRSVGEVNDFSRKQPAHVLRARRGFRARDECPAEPSTVGVKYWQPSWSTNFRFWHGLY